MQSVPLDAAGWAWSSTNARADDHLGRRCLTFNDTFLVAPLRDLHLTDGAIELDLCVTPERGFHGVVWSSPSP